MNTPKAILTIAALSIVCLVVSAFGGDGKVVVGPPHKMDLNLFYNYNEADMDSFKNAFTEASKLMFNATNGQLQFGTIRVSKNATFQNKADFWVLSGEGGANAGGFGILGNASGIHVTIYREQHRFTAEDGPDGNERGQFGLVHELGHHAFDLRNEYHGAAGEYAYCIDATSSIACIMDGGTSVHPTHHRTEWCTDAGGGLSTAHYDGSPTNHQEAVHGESCWETLADYCSGTYGAAMNEPVAVDTGNPAGHVNPAWIVLGNQLRYVICVDKSGSMAGTKLDKAKAGADLFVDLGHEGTHEYIAVTSFSGGAGYDPPADVDFALTDVVDDTIKDHARTHISGINDENMTAIGDGMRVSLNELETLASDDACSEVVVLLSDGVHNYGSEHPDDVIPDLRGRGVRVFTIGLGDPADPIYPLDEGMLQHIADETGGLYTHAPTEEDLATIYTTYCAEARGAEVCGEDTGELSPDKYVYEQVYIDQLTKEATFVLHWPTPRAVLLLELETPDGNIINPEVAEKDPYIKFVRMGNYEFYRVQKPMRGTWKLLIRASQGPSRIPFTAQTLAEAPGVNFSISIKRHQLKYPQVPIIQASLSAGAHVAGAKVEGVVVRPNPEQGGPLDTVPIRLYDDGLYVHGDEMADDGIYSNRFLEFSRDGSYQFRLTATNETGTEATPDEPADPDWLPKPIPPFKRVAKNTVIIRGLPTTLPWPKIAEVAPREGRQRQSLDVTISGGNFVENALVDFGSGIAINSVELVAAGKLVARITIDADATVGPRDVKVTNPGGHSDVAVGAFTVRPEIVCFPSKYSTFNDWVVMGRPVCWCAETYGGSGYQCDGDADGNIQGPQLYRVMTNDLALLVQNWKATIKSIRNPCADIDHKAQGPQLYRVMTNDLAVLVKNWKKTDAKLPGDCPRPE